MNVEGKQNHRTQIAIKQTITRCRLIIIRFFPCLLHTSHILLCYEIILEVGFTITATLPLTLYEQNWQQRPAHKMEMTFVLGVNFMYHFGAINTSGVDIRWIRTLIPRFRAVDIF